MIARDSDTGLFGVSSAPLLQKLLYFATQLDGIPSGSKQVAHPLTCRRPFSRVRPL